MAEDLDEEFTLKLTGKGLNIDRIVGKDVAMAVAAAVFGSAMVAPQARRFDTSEHPIEMPPLSPREFLTRSRASSNAEQITALGHFLCQHEAKESFSRDDLKEGFRRAHEGIPKNLPRDVGSAVKMGWIHETPGPRGRYYVTNTGIQLVETKFGRSK